ncbi:MAG: DNA-3-methyladenine glycosylase 2 family protein [Butyrivibrio sp.]|nr:hypothetical protein [Muribaculum sp.]MCM1551619.1 DNA-3-methyladenine glycosylase 2 family protein [Butyrivibrio sp.]
MIIQINDDFNLQKIADSGQCFRCKTFGDTYRFITGDNIIYIRQETANHYNVSCTAADWEQVWSPYFDLGRNYANIRRNAASDSFMSKAMEAGTGIRILRQDPWETLISFIISQRKNIPAIKKSIEAMADAFGEKTRTEYESLSLFPTSDSLRHATLPELSACSLGYRVPYIQDAATRLAGSPELLEAWAALDDDTLFTTLKTIKGIGDKVANCVMLFAYARTSRAPIDTWIAKLIDEEYDGVNPFPKYGENAGIMQQYAFYYMQQNK